MVKAVAVSADPVMIGRLREELAVAGGVDLVKVLDHNPQEEELLRFLQVHAPALIFLDVGAMDAAIGVAAWVERMELGIQIVALHPRCDPASLLRLMRAGIREVVLSSLSKPDELRAALGRVAEVLRRLPPTFQSTDRLFCFLPAKPGSGASVLAVNAAQAMARVSQDRMLLADFDLHQGVVSFLLRMTNSLSVADLAARADELDEDLWKSVVTTRRNLDVLGSCSNMAAPFALDQVRAIVDYARRVYKAICIDLSGSLVPYSVELLRNAKEIFLVCTHDVACLHLARGKADSLRSFDLAERTSILLNRSDKRSAFSIEEIQKVTGLRVRFSFPNNENRVNASIATGTQVETSSDLGQQLQALAKFMLGDASPAPAAPKRRFGGYFSAPPSLSSSAKS